MKRTAGQFLSELGGLPPVRGAAGIVQRDPGDASIGTGNFGQGVPAFWFARSLEYGSAENLYYPYADSPYVRDAIRQIAQPISSCELMFTKPSAPRIRQVRPGMKRISTSRGIIYRDQSELLDLPQVAAWLREPMRDLTWQDFVEASIGWLKLQECFWILAGNMNVPFPELKTPGPVKIVNPGRMRPTMEGDEIIGWTYVDAGGKTMKYDVSQVVRLRGWNPYNEHRGLGDYRAAHLAAEADWLAGKFSRNLMANNGDTSRIIVVKGGQPTDEQRQQILMQFKERREASQRGQNRDVVVGGDVDLQNAQLASVDSGYISQRLENRHEIFISFGVPPSMADIANSYSIGSASDMFRLLINTCIPTGGKFCASLEKLIKRQTGQDVEVGLNWDEHPCMQEVRKERLDSIAKLASQGMPMEQINEYLALGLVEFAGWEVGYLPINVQSVLNPDGEVAATAQPDEFAEPINGGDATTGDEKPINDEEPEVKAMLAALQGRCGHGHHHKAGGKNKQIWEAHMRLRSAAIKLYKNKCSRLFNDYRATALKRLAGTQSKGMVAKSLLDIIFSPEHFSRDLKKGLDPVARTVLQNAGEELFTEIGREDDPWKMAPQTALRFIQGRDKLLADVGATAQAQLNTALSAGMAAGETTEQLTDRVKGVFNNLQNFEAKRIAMTETSAAYGFSRHEAMTDAGIEYKGWLSSHGPTTREAHAEAEERYADSPIPLDEPFEVDGESLMYPGDPNGSPGNVINCHCIQLAAEAPKAGKEDGDE